jgi:hypothetical protein
LNEEIFNSLIIRSLHSIKETININEIKSGFDPALRDIKSRYVSLEDALIKIVKALKFSTSSIDKNNISKLYNTFPSFRMFHFKALTILISASSSDLILHLEI